MISEFQTCFFLILDPDCAGFSCQFAQIWGWVEAGNRSQDEVDPLATPPQSGSWAGMCGDSSCQNWMNMVKPRPRANMLSSKKQLPIFYRYEFVAT